MSATLLEKLERTSQPYVPGHIAAQGGVHLVWMNENDPVSPVVIAQMNASATRSGLRIAGGCSNMSAADREGMLLWFANNLVDFSGFVSSGGTREVTVDGMLDPMVTEVPALLAAGGKVVTISTVPRVGPGRLNEHNQLTIVREDKYGKSVTHPNSGVHMIVFVQQQLGGDSGWDGDVATYFRVFNDRIRFGGWQFACIVWNGGGVTKTEAKMAARSGWPVILVKGSGRGADELINELESTGHIDLTLPDDESTVTSNDARHHFYIVDKDDSRSLARQLGELGYPIG